MTLVNYKCETLPFEKKMISDKASFVIWKGHRVDVGSKVDKKEVVQCKEKSGMAN